VSLTTDPTTPCLHETRPDGQNKCYLVLSDQELAKGFVRPVRYAYRHIACGCTTTMGEKLSETYARDPKFYGATFCVMCGSHFPLVTPEGRQFEWIVNGVPDGSFVGE
jgi:hypothetical protein